MSPKNFFSSAVTQLNGEPTSGNPVITNPANDIVAPSPNQTPGQFQLRIRGQPGQRFLVQSSGDLIKWTDLETVKLIEDTYEFADPTSDNSNAKFYRALAVD